MNIGDAVEVIDEKCAHYGCVGTIVRECNDWGAEWVARFDGENKRWNESNEWVPYSAAQLRSVVV